LPITSTFIAFFSYSSFLQAIHPPLPSRILVGIFRLIASLLTKAIFIFNGIGWWRWIKYASYSKMDTSNKINNIYTFIIKI